MLVLGGANVATLTDLRLWTGGGDRSCGGGEDMTMGVEVLKAKSELSLLTGVAG